MTKHVCRHCGMPRSGHQCTVARKFVAKHDDAEFAVIMAAPLTTPQAEIGRLFPADPAPQCQFSLPFNGGDK